VWLNYPKRTAQRGRVLPKKFDNVTLFIGANGAGKTTVFKGVCLSVLAPIIGNSGFRAEFLIRRPVGYTGDTPSRGNGEKALPNSSVNVELQVNEVDTDVPTKRLLGQVVIHRRGDTEDITTAMVGDGWERIYENASPAFFLVAYSANRRAANPEGYTERNRSPRYQRVAGIFEEYFGLVPFTVGYLELAQCGRLEDAIRILNKLLPDGVELSGTKDHEGRPLFDSHGVLHPFTALSDGYRGFISWIWDMLVQMARTLPSNLDNLSGGELVKLQGVVIVDEIDLFLHPRWQRFLIEELATEFPNLQFIFSTHSPLVVGMLESANLRIIRRDGEASIIEQYTEEVEGKTPNEILTSSYFNLSSTRSPASGTLSEQVERELEAEGGYVENGSRRLGELRQPALLTYDS